MDNYRDDHDKSFDFRNPILGGMTEKMDCADSVSDDPLLLLEELSNEEKDLLRYSWKTLSKIRVRVACRIFQMIFEQSPDAKILFNFKTYDYERSAHKSNEFTFHAVRFMQIVETTVNMLDDVEGLRSVVNNLGKVHVRVKEQRGFSAHHWNVFVECTIYTFRKEFRMYYDEELDTIVILWRILLGAIVQTMQRSFEQKVEQNGQSRDEFDSAHHGDNHQLLLSRRCRTNPGPSVIISSPLDDNGNSTKKGHRRLRQLLSLRPFRGVRPFLAMSRGRSSTPRKAKDDREMGGKSPTEMSNTPLLVIASEPSMNQRVGRGSVTADNSPVMR